MARIPNSPYLMTLYSNFIVEVRKDGSVARTQLQLAAKAGPNMLDRYFIYTSQEAVKKIKNDSESLHWLTLILASKAHVVQKVLASCWLNTTRTEQLSPSNAGSTLLLPPPLAPPYNVALLNILCS
jgi:hypothetical protein